MCRRSRKNAAIPALTWADARHRCRADQDTTRAARMTSEFLGPIPRSKRGPSQPRLHAHASWSCRFSARKSLPRNVPGSCAVIVNDRVVVG
jgi:hypothetical protein